MSSYKELKRSITALEAQRGILSDDVIDTSIAALQKQLAGLEAPAQQRKTLRNQFVGKGRQAHRVLHRAE